MNIERRDFLRATALTALTSGVMLHGFPAFGESVEFDRNVTYRGAYSNSRLIFERTKRGRVAFLGGSITEMDGYRPMVCDFLRARFPETEFDFIAAGVSSTCSDVGAFRLATDVLSRGQVDLFFVEYAVNDDQDGRFDLTHSLRGMEGIVRHIRRANPNVDIVMTFFANENLMAQYASGKVGTSIQAHSKVAERYDISTVNLCKEIQEEIASGALTWQEYGGVHPAPRGNRICADMIETILTQRADGTELQAHAMPEALDPYSYSNASWRGFDGVGTNVGVAITAGDALAQGAFQLYEPDWSKIPGSFRSNFGGKPLLCGERPGAELNFEFDGNALAFYILAGPDAGMIEYAIDGGAPQRLNAFHDYSAGLHYPRAITLADALKDARHTVKLRLLDDKDSRSKGTALRILQIAVNRGE